MNNFEELEHFHKEGYNQERHERIQQKVNDTLGTYRFLGQVVDIYVPRLLDAVVEIAGGKKIPPSDTNTQRRAAPTDPEGPDSPSGGGPQQGPGGGFTRG